jgi:hypothetical protein
MFGGTDTDTSVPGELMGQVRHQMASNVALVSRLADGGALCPVPIVERSGCFCTRGAMQNYDVVYSCLGKSHR